VCVVGKMRDLILQLSKSSIYSTKPQGYLHFSADELREPARAVERAILEYAGIMTRESNLDEMLLSMVGKMTEEEKRKAILSLLYLNEVKDK
ncbi:hypothetical protein V6078_27070, partial [Klebsiella pneumoniae]